MRVTTFLITVGALVGPGLADFLLIQKSMTNVMEKAKAADEAIVAWSGDVTSGGDMLCKTIALRKSLKACAKAFESSKTLQRKEFTHLKVLPFGRLAVSMFDLKDHAMAARPKFDGVGATATMYEVFKAQKDSTSELSQTMDTVISKLPKSFRDTQFNLGSGPVKMADFARVFMTKELDELIAAFKPRPGQVSAMTPFVMIADKYSDSIDVGPFCRALPPLLKFFSAQQDVSLGDLTDKVVGVLKTSGVQDLVPLDIIKQNAAAFGIPAETIPKLLQQFGVQAEGVPLKDFTKYAPKILRSFKLQDTAVNPSRILRFLNRFSKNVLGSEAPPPIRSPKPKQKRSRHGQYM